MARHEPIKEILRGDLKYIKRIKVFNKAVNVFKTDTAEGEVYEQCLQIHVKIRV
jgi:hypothetical protein